jgi:hypothetical protein
MWFKTILPLELPGWQNGFLVANSHMKRHLRFSKGAFCHLPRVMSPRWQNAFYAYLLTLTDDGKAAFPKRRGRSVGEYLPRILAKPATVHSTAGRKFVQRENNYFVFQAAVSYPLIRLCSHRAVP